MGTKYTLKTIATAIERYHCGESATSVAKDLGVSSGMVSKWYEKYYLNKVNNPTVMVVESKINYEREGEGITQTRFNI